MQGRVDSQENCGVEARQEKELPAGLAMRNNLKSHAEGNRRWTARNNSLEARADAITRGTGCRVTRRTYAWREVSIDMGVVVIGEATSPSQDGPGDGWCRTLGHVDVEVTERCDA